MPNKIRKAVFPAAGLGTRFLPATKASPKEMLPLVDKPLIQYGVEEAVASGIESILIVTGRDKAAIENHFDISFELEQVLKERGKTEALEQVRAVAEMAKISYIRQRQALGLGHAIYQAKGFVGDEPFAVLLPDDIVDAEKSALQQLIKVYEKYNAPVIATMQVAGEAISRFGVIDAEEVELNVFKIKDFVEKPKFEDAPSDMAIVGRYIFTPEIFDALENTKPGAGGEIQVADAVRPLLDKGRPFYAVKLNGVRHDAGDKLGFLIATVEFALKRNDLGADFREYLKSLNLK
ncbi:MAG: UTP--glucose-1-phosphate uridylyltransferase GalU [Acidobacteria bacterium]|nr:UTP--glucose-1-phosphate uridylyltransferase GalU [Acidobacteriota bacterium]MCA1638044.1 UTP--glucose-1-phosphate uridylyltransferase GalU [Acidobacteriota bacterium]